MEGDWLVALRQEQGRGRQGREWLSLDGNFFGSTLVQVRDGDPPAPTLALAAGLAMIEAVGTAAPGRALLLKWPNDLLLDGGKAGGILLERSGERIVAGFGVNLAAAPALPDRPTASLGGTITPQAFAPLLAASFTRILAAWRSSPPEAVARAWLEKAHPIGSPVEVHVGPGERVAGIFAGLDADGAMLVQLKDGSVETVRAGDVKLG